MIQEMSISCFVTATAAVLDMVMKDRLVVPASGIQMQGRHVAKQRICDKGRSRLSYVEGVIFDGNIAIVSQVPLHCL